MSSIGVDGPNSLLLFVAASSIGVIFTVSLTAVFPHEIVALPFNSITIRYHEISITVSLTIYILVGQFLQNVLLSEKELRKH